MTTFNNNIRLGLKEVKPLAVFKVNEFRDILLVINVVLKQVGLDHLLDYLSNVNIYEYDLNIIDGNGDPIYSFAVIEGESGDKLKDKMFYDPINKEIVNSFYVLPQNNPFIVLGKENTENKQYKVASIIHELTHIVIQIAQDDNVTERFRSLIPSNISTITEPEEVVSMILECRLLKRYKNKGDIIKYLIDRYLPGYYENKEESQGYIDDFKILVSI